MEVLFEYFSLKGMGLCNDAVEIEFENADKELYEKVMGAFVSGDVQLL